MNNYYDAEIKITDRRTVKINGTYIFWYDYSWVSYNKETGKEEVLHNGMIALIREWTEWILKEGIKQDFGNWHRINGSILRVPFFIA